MPTLQQKRGTSAALAAVNPTPLAGEIVWVSDTNTLRVGDGTTVYSSLAVISATPTSHSHGNITNAGAIGSTANLPIITTTSGVLTTGSFGTTAATFCQGNDSRLSDTRTPTDNTVSTAKLQDDAVTYAKIQNVSATDRLLGRSSAGSGDVEEVTCTAAGRALLSGADAAAQRTTLSVQPTASPAFTGAATFANTGNVVPLTITNTGTANSFVVNDASGDPTPFVIDASGNVGIKATSTASSLNVVGNSAFYQDANGTPSLGSKSFYAATFENFSAGYGLAIGGVSGATGACIVQVQSFTISAAYDMLLQPLGGNVGIGTTTPGGRLEVAGGQLLVTAGSGSSGSYKPGVAVSGDDDTGLQQVGGTNTISLVTAGTERLRVGSDGAVGISTDPVTGFPLSLFSFATSDANKATLLLNGTVASGQSFAGIRFTHNVFSTGWAADIRCVDTGNFGGILSFRTSATGSATATPTERMRIDASGNVGIGAAPSDRLHVEQSSGIATIILKSAASVAARINFQTTTDGNGYINYDTGAWKFFTNNAGAATERVQIASDGKLYAFNTYGTTVGATNRDLFIDSGGLIGYVSSIRASKTNIAAIDDVSWLRDLTPVSFHYRRKNEDGTYSDEPDGTLDYGLIAEEVEPVAPNLCFYDVVDGEPQLRGVHYSKLITPMLRYIQQLEQRIAALEERNHA